MRKFALNLGVLSMALMLVLGTSSCKKEDSSPSGNDDPQMKTIAQVADENGNFTILIDALTRTDLVDAVSDESASLTVFAPTDQAFADLLSELNLADLDAVETALGTEGLKNVLLYHVLGAKVESSMVETGYASTLGMTSDMDALSLYISTESGVRINDRANVLTADVMASNGVIHVIDTVILPLSIYDLLMVNKEFTSLTAALGVADGNLDDLLDGEMNGPYTLFAPDNMAFESALMELNMSDLTELVTTLGTDGVADVLLYHVVAGNFNSDEVPSGEVTTALTQKIDIDLSNGVNITDAKDRISTVKTLDIQGVNGVIHSVNKVLLPM